MPVDNQASHKDKMKAIGTLIFMVVAFVVIYLVASATGGAPAPHK